MNNKSIIILGSGLLAFEIADQVNLSKELIFSGFIKEIDVKLAPKYSKHDLGTDTGILKTLKPDICIALNYHKIIPEDVLRNVKIINSHGGILPENRGYHASGWGFINMDKELGYSLHLMDEGTDSGPVLYTFKYKVGPDTTFNDLKKEIYNDQKRNLVKIVSSYLNGKIIARPQKIKVPKYFGKRNIADCCIDWSMSSDFINNFIRALSIPSGPGAFTVYKNKKMIIINSQKYECDDYIEIPGHVVHKEEDRVLVKTGDKCLWIEDIIFDNKKFKAGKFFSTAGSRLGINLTEELLKQKKII